MLWKNKNNKKLTKNVSFFRLDSTQVRTQLKDSQVSRNLQKKEERKGKKKVILKLFLRIARLLELSRIFSGRFGLEYTFQPAGFDPAT